MSDIDIYRETLQALLARCSQDHQAAQTELDKYQGQPDGTRIDPPFPTSDRSQSPAREAWEEYEAAKAALASSGLSGQGVRVLSGTTSTGSFVTDGGYRIDFAGYTVTFKDPQGRRITQISGDPHVYEGTDGTWDWHFGGSSTFILPDGSKVFLTTQQSGSNRNVKVAVGVDIQSGEQRAFAGKDAQGRARQASVVADRAQWDTDHRDSVEQSGGVFALQPGTTQWAKLVNGEFYDVSDESWQQYQRDPDVDVNMGRKVQVNDEQRKAMSEAPVPSAPAQERLNRALQALEPYAATTVGELRQLVSDLASDQSGPVREELDRLNSSDTEQRMQAENRASDVARLPTPAQRLEKVEQMAKDGFGSSW